MASQMKYKPVIVVVAYNRPGSLERIFFSLKKLKNISSTKLIISIDNKAPENYSVRDIALAFEWPFGEKEVIYNEKRLGLRNHVLQCGDLSIKYGSVIILEDDLFVSPYMYEYAVQALEYYGNDDKIGGISLYNPTLEEITQMPFSPINDDSDVYFMQFPSSLGQAWTKKHWELFREWLPKNQDISNVLIHKHIINWPKTSWKKYFTAYLAAGDKYFVFPRISLTTNFNDPGTHEIRNINFNWQAHLRIEHDNYRFKMLSTSHCIYDSYYEILPSTIKHYSSKLKDYDFEIDLYGRKDLKKISKPLVITSRPVKNAIWSYKRALKPHEMNIIFELEGNDLFFGKKEDVLSVKSNIKRELSDHKYFFSSIMIGKKAFLYEYLSKYKLFSLFFK